MHLLLELSRQSLSVHFHLPTIFDHIEQSFEDFMVAVRQFDLLDNIKVMGLAEQQILHSFVSVHGQLDTHGLSLYRLPFQLLLLLKADHLKRPHLLCMVMQPGLELFIAHLPHFNFGADMGLLVADLFQVHLETVNVSLTVLVDGVLQCFLSQPAKLQLLAQPRNERRVHVQILLSLRRLFTEEPAHRLTAAHTFAALEADSRVKGGPGAALARYCRRSGTRAKHLPLVIHKAVSTGRGRWGAMPRSCERPLLLTSLLI